ncbi:MAG TPA: hypothetical protein VNC50_03070, partial [Planctomycetia bacterium]|nr:hypothetical protein [Planctomycetia bacterium]
MNADHVPLVPFFALAGRTSPLDGRLTGAATFSAAAVGLKVAPTSLATWSGEVDLTGEALRVRGAPVELRRLRGRWRSPALENFRLEAALSGSPIAAEGGIRFLAEPARIDLNRILVSTAFGEAFAEGAIPLDLEQPARAKLQLRKGDLGTLSRLLGPERFAGSGPVEGSITLDLPAPGDRPRTLAVAADLSGAIAGKGRVAIPLESRDSFTDAVFAGEGEADFTLAAPVVILQRTIDDLRVGADWRAGSIRVERIGAQVGGVRFAARGRGRIEDAQATFEDVVLDFFGGRATGSFRVPRRRDIAGGGRFDLDGLDLSNIAVWLPEGSPRLVGRISGKGEFALPAAPNPRGPRAIVAAAELELPRLAVERWSAEKIAARVRTEGGVAVLSAKGESVGGVFEWNGVEVLPQGTLSDDDDGAPLAGRGELSLRGVDVGQLVASAPGTRIPADQVRGALDARLRYRRPEGAATQGSGDVEIRALVNRAGTLARRLASNVVYDGRRLRLSQIDGDLLEGRLRGSLEIDSQRPADGAAYRVDVLGMSLPRFFTQIGVDPGLFEGYGDARFDGRITTAVAGRGTIEVGRGSFASIDLSSWRSPAEFEVDLRDYSGKFGIPRAAARMAQGRLLGSLDYRWGRVSSFDAEAEFTNLDLKSLRRSSTSAGSFAAGRVAGRLKLAAPNMRSWNDLAGSFAARMSDTQPAATPAYDRVLTLLTGLGGQAMTFNTGTVKGTVGGGRTRIEDLQLVAQRARISGS